MRAFLSVLLLTKHAKIFVGLSGSLCFKTSDISLIRWDLDAAIGAYNQPLLEWKDNDLFCS